MTPGRLIHVVSDALCVDVNTVTQLDQKLAAAGLRSKSGRGPSAADVTSRDAAMLVLTVLAQADVAVNRRDGRTLENAREITDAKVMPGRPKMPNLPEFSKAMERNDVSLADALGGFITDLKDPQIAGRYRKSGDFHLAIQRPEALAVMKFGDSGEFDFSGVGNIADRRPIIVTVEMGAAPLRAIAIALRS